MLEDSMKEKIIQIAKGEFLANGYLGASTRNIAQKAGLTTGALYNRFIGKDELFEEVVGSSANKLLDEFSFSHEEFMNFDLDIQIESMFTYSHEKVQRMLDIVYSDIDAFNIILTKSSGSRYEFYIDNMVEMEVESTFKFIDVLKQKGKEVVEIDETLMHMICTAMFNLFFEPVKHGMDKDKASKYVENGFKFFDAGWSVLFDSLGK